MIKVSDSTLVDCRKCNLDKIADKHLSKVNPRSKKNNQPIKRSIYSKIVEFKGEVIVMII